MKILSVNVRNFRSYSEMSLSFENSGLILIDGYNEHTGRSNMTGKTTAMDSVFWCLFGYLPKWGGPKGGPVDAVIKRGEKKCAVQVNLEHDGKKIFIRRERPSKLVIEVNGNVVDGKLSDLDSRIPELIGVTAAQFLLSIYISQDRNTSFFTMGDTERTQLLSIIAGLEKLDAAYEESKEQKKLLEIELVKTESIIDLLTKQKEEFPARTEKLDAQISEAEKAFDSATSEYDRVHSENEKEYDLLVKEHLSQIGEWDKTLDILIKSTESEKEQVLLLLKNKRYELASVGKIDPLLLSQVEEAENALKECEKYNALALNAKVFNEEIRRQISDHLDASNRDSHEKCDSCGQEMPESAKKTAKLKHLELIATLEDRLKEELTPKDIAPYAKRYEQLYSEYLLQSSGPENKKIAINAEIQALEKELKSIEKSASVEIQMCKDKRSSILRVIEHLKYRSENEKKAVTEGLKRAVDALDMLTDSKKALADKIKSHDQAIEGATSEWKAIGIHIDEESDLIDLFGPKGLRTIFFDGIIQRIASRASELLINMTDGIYNTRIDQIGETAKGEQRLILRPIITKGGIEVPVDDLSGAGRRTVMLAYDVAVSEAITDCNILFLDESMDGLDSIGKMEALKLLEEVSRNRAVYITDHTSEIKSSIQNVIHISYKDDTSSIVSSKSENSPKTALN